MTRLLWHATTRKLQHLINSNLRNPCTLALKSFHSLRNAFLTLLHLVIRSVVFLSSCHIGAIFSMFFLLWASRLYYISLGVIYLLLGLLKACLLQKHWQICILLTGQNYYIAFLETKFSILPFEHSSNSVVMIIGCERLHVNYTGIQMK